MHLCCCPFTKPPSVTRFLLFRGLHGYGPLGSVVLLVFLAAAAPHAAARQPDYAQPCDRGVAAFEERQLDSAFYYFARAYSRGMPADSLYYFWANVYLARNVYDSALALNYAIQDTGRTRFRRQVLEQRRDIFERLGWTVDVAKMDDSLQAWPGYRLRRLLPALSLDAGAGYRYQAELVDTSFPWGERVDGGRERSHQYDYRAAADLRWRVPMAGRASFVWGIDGGVSQPYSDFGDADSTDDSLHAWAGIGLGLADLWDVVTVEYTFSRRRDRSGGSFEQSVAASAVFVRDWFSALLLGAYGMDFESDSDSLTQNAWVYGRAGGRRRWAPVFSILGSWYAGPALSNAFALDRYSVYYVDGVTTDGIIRHYTDSTFAHEVDSQGLAPLSYVNAIQAAADTLTVTRYLPQSFVQVEPAIGLEVELSRRSRIDIGLSWRGTWYLEEYEWLALPDSTHTTYYYDRTSRQYYQAEDPILDDLFSGSKELRESFEQVGLYRRERRFDSALLADLSYRARLGNAGTLRMRAQGGRTWSTLAETPIVDIPQWSWALGLSWSVTMRRK